MATKIENREEIILFALKLREDEEESIPKIRSKVEIKFKKPVSQSFMQKNLLKYKGCRTTEDMKERDKQKGSNEPKKDEPKKEWSPDIKHLGNQVIDQIYGDIDTHIVNTPLMIKPPLAIDNMLDFNEVSKMKDELKEYLTEKLSSIIEVYPNVPEEQTENHNDQNDQNEKENQVQTEAEVIEKNL